MTRKQRVNAIHFGTDGLISTPTGFEFRVGGTCVAKLDSNGNWVIKGDLTTNESNPCA